MGGFRHRPREPWTLLVSHGDKAAAERLLISMAAESKTSGDWCVRQTATSPTTASAWSATASGPIGRQRRT
jgi:hypothetical protein